MIFTTRYNQKYGDSIPDEISTILKTIENGLISNAQKNNEKIFVNLILYLRDELIFLTSNKSKRLYLDLLLIPSYIYNYLPESYQKKLIEIFTIRFSENISRYENYQKNTEYIEISYYGLINLIKFIIYNRNVEHFNLLMKSLKETMFSSTIGENKKYRYYFTLTIYLWLIYLQDQKKIDILQYDLTILENILDEDIYEQKENIFNIFYDLQEDIENGLWGVADWYLERPPVGVGYFALMPKTWLSFSFIIFLLKFNLTSYNLNIEQIKIKDIFRFELDRINEDFLELEINLINWLDFLYPTIENKTDIYNENKEKIKNFYSELKTYQENKYLSVISKIPISNSKIENFKNIVGDLFYKNAIIPNLLKYFGRVKYLDNIFEKNGIGEYVNMQKSRFAFIDGEYYQGIIGLTDIGARVANFVNKDFFRSLSNFQKQDNLKFNNKDLITQIDDFLRTFDKATNIIIIGNWKSLDLLKGSIEYISSSIPYCHSSYKGIPIISIYDFSKNILVLDIGSIDYSIYQKEEWYNKELLVEVTEPDEKTNDFTNTNIHIKILFKSEIIINNKNGYKFFKIE